MNNNQKLKKIKELLELKENGIITENEFELSKAKVINSKSSIVKKEKIILIIVLWLIIGLVIIYWVRIYPNANREKYLILPTPTITILSGSDEITKTPEATKSLTKTPEATKTPIITKAIVAKTNTTKPTLTIKPTTAPTPTLIPFDRNLRTSMLLRTSNAQKTANDLIYYYFRQVEDLNARGMDITAARKNQESVQADIEPLNNLYELIYNAKTNQELYSLEDILLLYERKY